MLDPRLRRVGLNPRGMCRRERRQINGDRASQRCRKMEQESRDMEPGCVALIYEKKK